VALLHRDRIEREDMHCRTIACIRSGPFLYMLKVSLIYFYYKYEIIIKIAVTIFSTSTWVALLRRDCIEREDMHCWTNACIRSLGMSLRSVEIIFYNYENLRNIATSIFLPSTWTAFLHTAKIDKTCIAKTLHALDLLAKAYDQLNLFLL